MTLPKLSELTDQTNWMSCYDQMLKLVHESDEARALVLQALLMVQKNKDLSFGEREMFDAANNYKEYIKQKEDACSVARKTLAIETRKQFKLIYGKE
jgi:RNA polymerase-interacting CarD/CdnL/TRCF family regulator